MKDKPDAIDWELTTWEGSRREQMRRWSQMSLDEILAAQEQMANLAVEMHIADAGRVREEPPTAPKS